MKEGKFTTTSDVWSYGIVIYEVWSLGLPPYSDFRGDHVSLYILVSVEEGYRLPSPPECPASIHQIMLLCW